MAENGTVLFARHDNADPSKDLDLSQKGKYDNVGVAFPANENIAWAMVYKHEDLSDAPPA